MNPKNQKKNLISFLLWAILAFCGTCTFASAAAGQGQKISLSTMEFGNYRRIILTSPNRDTGYFVSPAIEEEPEEGEFTLDFSPVDSAAYVGKRLTREYGKMPIQLSVSFPDSQTLRISGKSLKFDKLVGYYQLGEERYIFDIYTEAPHESYFNETSISTGSLTGYTEDGRFKIVTGFPPPGKLVAAGPLGTREKFWQRLKISLVYTLYVALTLALAALVMVAIQKYLPKFVNKVSWNSRPELKRAHKAADTQAAPSKNTMIDKLMRIHGLSYDEAMIRLALTSHKLDVKI